LIRAVARRTVSEIRISKVGVDECLCKPKVVRFLQNQRQQYIHVQGHNNSNFKLPQEGHLTFLGWSWVRPL
jgi:hypothetical protein